MEKSIEEKWKAAAAIKEPLSAEEESIMCWTVNERFANSSSSLDDLLVWMGSFLATILRKNSIPPEVAMYACGYVYSTCKKSVEELYDLDEAAEDTEATNPQTDEATSQQE